MHSVLSRAPMVLFIALALAAAPGLPGQEAGKPPPAEGYIPVFELGEKGLAPAPKVAASFRDQGIPPDGEVTVVYTPGAISAEAAVSALKELLGVRQPGPPGPVFGPGFRTVEVAGSRKLILSGTAMRVEQALQILRAVDVARPSEAGEPAVTVFSIVNASASSIQEVLAGLFRDSDPWSPRILVDGRTNALIVFARPGQIDFFKKVIEQLDIPMNQRRVAMATRIVPLRVADAKDVAILIQNLKGQGSSATGARAARPAMPAQPSSFRIVVDDRTNSLIIEAYEEEMEALLDLIGRLDVRASDRKEPAPAPAEEGKRAPGAEKKGSSPEAGKS